ncbi:MAG: right-handed parallel beta-helix repeat-containing protein [Deltaproteobacteria bacterium]|nr:right-handed parallel beta-helix repeat-containing protein [Deltaproteobacteria bacterium]
MTLLRSFGLASFLLAAACTVGDAGGPGGGSNNDGPDAGAPVAGEISGTIAADQTWSGTVTLTANATIPAGVTVTVEPGTIFHAAANAQLHVIGTLTVNGTKASPVSMEPSVASARWAGIVADAGAKVDLTYASGHGVATLVYCHEGATCGLDHVDFSDLGVAITNEGTTNLIASHIAKVSNGGVTARAGTLTIRDSYVLTSTGDIIVQSGGALVIEYSEIGDAQGSYEHCDLHIGAAGSLSITHSNIRNGVYGMMIGGTTNALIQYNNFIANGPAPAGADIDEVGTNTAADFQFNYWDHGAPTALGASYNFGSPAAAMITDAGPRAANL